MISLVTSLKWRSMGRHFFWVALLGFMSGLPFSLLGSTLAAWFSSHGVSITTIGFLSLLQQPYVFKFLWAPLVDINISKYFDRRRSWIYLCQLLLALGLFSFTLLNPKENAILIGMIAFVMVIASATQDIAIDAFRAEILSPKERGLGATVTIASFRIATMISGAATLVVADYYGWSLTFILLFLFLIPFWLLLTSIKNSTEKNNAAPLKEKKFSLWQSLKMFLVTREGVYTLAFVLLFKLGEAFTSTSSVLVIPFLQQGLGFSLTAIGVIGKGVAIMATLTGSLLAGLILLRLSLYKGLFLFAFLQVLMNGLFVLLSLIGKNYTLLTICMFSENLVAGMGMTALVAFMMGVCDKNYTATQLALLSSLSALPRTFAGPIGGSIQSYVGWTNLFIIAVILAIPVLLVLKPLKSLIYKIDNEN